MPKNLIIAIVLVLSLPAFSQNQPDETTNANEMKFGVGAAAGFSTGYGLSFRYWPADWGIQLTTAPYISNGDTRISFGATVLNSIKQDEKVRLYVYFGNHILNEKWENNNPFYTNLDPVKSTMWIMGIGPGFEITILRKMSFNLMFGIASYKEYRTNYDPNWMLNMTAETGLYYKF